MIRPSQCYKLIKICTNTFLFINFTFFIPIILTLILNKIIFEKITYCLIFLINIYIIWQKYIEITWDPMSDPKICENDLHTPEYYVITAVKSLKKIQQAVSLRNEFKDAYWKQRMKCSCEWLLEFWRCVAKRVCFLDMLYLCVLNFPKGKNNM